MGLLDLLSGTRTLIADAPVVPTPAASAPSSSLLPPSSFAAPPSDRPAAAAASSTAAPPATAESGEHAASGVAKARKPESPKSRNPEIPTLGNLVAAWVRGDTEAAARLVRLGAMADAWIAEQARHAVPRPEAIRRIVERLKSEGIRGESLRVNRIVAISWVARLFGYQTAKQLPVSTLRALLPLIKRQPTTAQWHIRPALKDSAIALWARIQAEHLSAAAVRAESLKLRPARIAPPSRSKPTRLLILRRMKDLSTDDLVYISGCIRERLQAIGHPGAQNRAA